VQIDAVVGTKYVEWEGAILGTPHFTGFTKWARSAHSF
jgi:hypothetical protein